MPLRHKRLVDIRAADIRSLVSRRIAEGQFVDFKAEMYPHSDEGKHELAKDVSAFANAYGGDIFIGVKAANGVANDLTPVKSAAKEIEWLLQVCHDLIEERISGLDAVPIRVKGGAVVVLRVPTSLRGPHMVRRGRQTYFYRRFGQQSAPMSLPDIREAFMRFASWQQQARDFFAGRAGEASKGFGYITGVLPVPIRENLVSIRDEKIKELLASPPDTRSMGWRARAGQEIRTTLFGLRSEVRNQTLIQVWRNGYLEFDVNTTEDNLDRLRIGKHNWESRPDWAPAYVIKNPIPLVEYAVTTVRLARAIQRDVGYVGPSGIWLYFSASAQPKMPSPGLADPDMWEVLGPDTLRDPMPYPILAGPYFVDSLDNPDSAAQIGLDLLWNAFGHDGAPFFDADGRCTIKDLPRVAI